MKCDEAQEIPNVLKRRCRKRESGGRRNKPSKLRVGSGDVGPEYLENRKEAEREAQGAQGLNENCRESAPFITYDQRFPQQVSLTWEVRCQ